MAHVLLDRAKVVATSMSGNTSNYTLTNAPPTGFVDFTGVGDGNTTYYAAVDNAGNFEIGIGTFATSGEVLTRTDGNVIKSTNSNNRVSWPSNSTPTVFITQPADKAVFTDANGDVTIKTSDGAILNLQTSDTEVNSGNTLGAIQFQAPDETSGGDAIEIAAVIEAESASNFKSSVIETDLVFKVANDAAATERMRLTHSGALELTSTTNEDNLLIKTTFGSEQGGTPDLKLYNDSTQAGTDNPLGVIKFNSNTANHSNHQFADILGMAFSTTQNALEGGVRFRFAEGSDHAWGANEWISFRPEKIQYYNGSATSTIAFTPPTSNRTITLPDADGTVVVSASSPLSINSAGNLSLGTVPIAADDITAGDAAVTIATTSGNITIDAQGSDTDIIFKGTDNTTDITALTLDMSGGGTALFNSSIRTPDYVWFHSDDDINLMFGGNFEIQVEHVHNTGLRLKNTTSPYAPYLQFVNADESIGSDGTNLILTSGGTAFKMPTADGSNTHVLQTDGSGNLSFVAPSGGGSSAADDITTGDAAVTIATTTGNITLDAQANDTLVEIKGNNAGGILQLNCESNSHGVKLQSPDHSAAQSYTLKLPDNQVAANKILKVKSITGSGATAVGQLEFADESGGGVTVQDEGSALSTTATTLDFVGAGVTASGTGATKTITISGGSSGITVQDEGSSLSTAGTTLDFVGAGVVASGTGATKTITIAGGGSGITVQDEGSSLSTAGTTLDFVGAGVTASGTGATKTVTISGGGGGGGITTGKAIAMAMVFG